MADYYAYSGTDTTWYTWNNDATSSANTCWQSWTSGTYGTSETYGANSVTVASRGNAASPSPEERARIEQDRQRLARESEERERSRRESGQRAEALLKSLLTDDQRKSLEEMKRFAIRSETGKPYRIRLESSMNVDELDEQGKVLNTYCLVPKEPLPLCDNLAIQKLMLETAEAEFLRIAAKRR